jgi:hypothetical protein
MNKKIDKKIVGFQVKTEEQKQEEIESNIVQMHEKVSRPEQLEGATYKIKTPLSDHALYLTICVGRLKYSLILKTWIIFSGLLP